MSNATELEAHQHSAIALSTAIVLMLLCVFGICGNSLSILVFLQRRLRVRSINVLLTFLSISDLCLLILALPVYISGPVVRFCKEWIFMRYVYTYSLVFLYPLTNIFHCCSVWLLVTVTLERWLAVCKPLLVATYCKRNRAYLSGVIILALSVSYNAVRFFENRLPNKLGLPTAALRQNQDYVLYYVTVSHLLFIYFVPLLTVIYFNSRTAFEIAKSHHRRKYLASDFKVNYQTSRMLLFVVLCFITCYTPCFLLNVAEALKPKLFASETGYILSDFNNGSVLFNSATTCLFYLKFSTRYRSIAKILLARFWLPAPSSGHRSNLASRFRLDRASPAASEHSKLATFNSSFVETARKMSRKNAYRMDRAVTTLLAQRRANCIETFV